MPKANIITRQVLKWLFVLVFILAVFSIYFVASPKAVVFAEENSDTSPDSNFFNSQTPDIQDIVVQITNKQVVFNKNPQHPTIIASLDNQPFNDFSIEYKQDDTAVEHAINAGEYTVDVVVMDNDNKVVIKSDIFIITPLSIDITLSPTWEYTYDGKEHFRVINYSQDQFPKEDGDIVATYNGLSSAKNAGLYDIELQSTNPNYKIGSVSGGLQLFISKRTLTISAKNLTIKEGDSSPFSYNYLGFAEGENASVLTSLPTITNIPTKYGEYTVRPQGASADNYNIIYTDSVLTINRVTIVESLADNSSQVTIKGNIKHNSVLEYQKINKKDSLVASFQSILKKHKQINSNKDIAQVSRLEFSQGGVYSGELFNVSINNVKLSPIYQYKLAVVDKNGNLFVISKYTYKDNTLTFNSYSDGTLILYRNSLPTYFIIGIISMILLAIIIFKISSHLVYKKQKEKPNNPPPKKKVISWD